MYQVTISRQFEFAAAHHLPNHKGLCQNLHGHNYIVIVEVEGPLHEEGEEAGMIVDFDKLSNVFHQIKMRLDHKNLNDVMPNPTAENISIWIAKELQRLFVVYIPYIDLSSVEVQENERSSAICYVTDMALEE